MTTSPLAAGSATEHGLAPAEPRQRIDLPPLPALVVGEVRHTRHRPLVHAFTHRHYQWLVELPEGTGLARPWRALADLQARDHLDSPKDLRALRHQVVERVATQGHDAQAVERVVMLTHARVLGHVFDPMTAYWCLTGSGAVVAVVVEVHNTYGGRHAYVIAPGADGRGSTAKEFFVSPFNDASGRYAVRFLLTPTRAFVSVQLRKPGADGSAEEPIVTASTDGIPRPATPGALVRTAVSIPLMTLRVSALIRWHGIRLWARRLPTLTPERARS